MVNWEAGGKWARASRRMFCESVRWRGRLPFVIIYFKKLNGNKERSMPGGRTPRAFRGRDRESVCARVSQRRERKGSWRNWERQQLRSKPTTPSLPRFSLSKGAWIESRSPSTGAFGRWQPFWPPFITDAGEELHGLIPWETSVPQQKAEAPAIARLGLGSGQRLSLQPFPGHVSEPSRRSQVRDGEEAALGPALPFGCPCCLIVWSGRPELRCTSFCSPAASG